MLDKVPRSNVGREGVVRQFSGSRSARTQVSELSINFEGSEYYNSIILRRLSWQGREPSTNKVLILKAKRKGKSLRAIRYENEGIYRHNLCMTHDMISRHGNQDKEGKWSLLLADTMDQRTRKRPAMSSKADGDVVRTTVVI